MIGERMTMPRFNKKNTATFPKSKHRHISFTAHYTGYIWYQMGISNAAFATRKGKILSTLLHPFETVAERLVGSSIRTTLKTRHTLLDEQLKKLIAKYPNLQVLEIAAGLSPRGWWFRSHYPEIIYRELDLPTMADIKQNALMQISSQSPDVLSADLFSHDFDQVFELFDLDKPLVIISEGLVNYFDKPLLMQLAKAIHHNGKSFKQLHYLTDLYPEPVKHPLSKLIWESSKLLKFMSKSAFTFHFTQPVEVQTFFKQAGFQQTEVIQPVLCHKKTSTYSNEHLGDLVWIVHAYDES